MLKEIKIRKNQSLVENGILADLRKVMNESFGIVRSSTSNEFQDRKTPPNIKNYEPPPTWAYLRRSHIM